MLVDVPEIPVTRVSDAKAMHAIKGDVLREDDDDELTPFELRRNGKRIGRTHYVLYTAYPYLEQTGNHRNERCRCDNDPDVHSGRVSGGIPDEVSPKRNPSRPRTRHASAS